MGDCVSGLRAIMDEMRDILEDAFSGSDVAVQVSSRMLKNSSPPSIDMYPGDPFNDGEAAGFDSNDGFLRFTVRARVNSADSDAGQDLLLAFMDVEDALSVSTALSDDQTLNGLASSVMVDGPSGYTEYVDPDSVSPGVRSTLLGCEWRVTILNLTS
jgi:hypothetical protein